eukprot:5494201-Amphidinium_carterae.1
MQAMVQTCSDKPSDDHALFSDQDSGERWEVVHNLFYMDYEPLNGPTIAYAKYKSLFALLLWLRHNAMLHNATLARVAHCYNGKGFRSWKNKRLHSRLSTHNWEGCKNGALMYELPRRHSEVKLETLETTAERTTFFPKCASVC